MKLQGIGCFAHRLLLRVCRRRHLRCLVVHSTPTTVCSRVLPSRPPFTFIFADFRGVLERLRDVRECRKTLAHRASSDISISQAEKACHATCQTSREFMADSMRCRWHCGNSIFARRKGLHSVGYMTNKLANPKSSQTRPLCRARFA